jgi:hypothetical protein
MANIVRHTLRHSYVTPIITVTQTPQKPYVTHHSVPIDTVCDVDWVSVCNDIANPFPSLYILKQIDASRNIVLNKYDGTYGSC